MYSAASVKEFIASWKAAGLSNPEIVCKIAEAELGWPYVWGASGSECNTTRRKYYAGRSVCPDGEKTQIYKTCPVLNNQQSSCSGCKWYPKQERVYINDCQGWVKHVMRQVGVTLTGAGCTSMWKDKSLWTVQGEIKDIPLGIVCCVFQYNSKKNNMQHIGITLNGTDIIHCSKTVKRGKVTDRGWTHFAIPKGLYKEGTDVIIPPTDTTVKLPTLRKGSKGSYVTLLQTQLLNRGYKLPKYGADGSFGNETFEAVKQFQRDWGLEPDGIVGSATWKMLETTLEKPNTYTVTMKGLLKDEAEELLKLHPGEMVLEK